MESQGKIVRDRAPERHQFKKSGWRLVPTKAFKNVDPQILAMLRPLPILNRQDYMDYLVDNDITDGRNLEGVNAKDVI